MKKYALEIRISTKNTREITAWFSKWYETKELFNKDVTNYFKLQDAYKNTHVTEIEFVGKEN